MCGFMQQSGPYIIFLNGRKKFIIKKGFYTWNCQTKFWRRYDLIKKIIPTALALRYYASMHSV